MQRRGETVLTVSEVFGPTIQGEGPSQGRAVVFLRLGLCNLDCSWCDTPYTWDWSGKNGVVYDKKVELVRNPTEQILTEILGRTNHNISRVVVSGGEPMIQQTNLVPLIRGLWGHGISVEIETNGTIVPNADMAQMAQLNVFFNCSPKLANSGVDQDKRFVPEALVKLNELGAAFKFVITGPEDLIEIGQVLETAGQVEPHRVHLMPEGTTANKIQKQLGQVMMQAAERGWSLSPRLHVLAFNDLRGV
jgi:7-carboxy-7-deazaguanine synthase